MSMAFRGQPQYAQPQYAQRQDTQAPTGGYGMSGYGGEPMPSMGDLGSLGDFSGFGNYGALSGPATMGGNYSMFGSYNQAPQQSYTGGYVPGYGSQFSGAGGYGGYGGFGGFGGYGGGYGGFGGYGMQQPPQPNVNDLFGQYMFGQYYGQPAFNPFQATSMFGGGRRGGFGGGRRGGRERFQQFPPVGPMQPPTPGRFGPVQQPTTQQPPPVQTPAVVDKNTTSEYWYERLKENNPGIDDARARELAESRAAAFRAQQSPAQPARPTQPAAPAGLYDTSNDDWGRGEGPIDASQLPSGFNWQAYLDAPSNADLRAAGVDTPSEAARHYLKYGRNENRTFGAPAAPAQPAPAVTQPVNPYNPYQQVEQLPYGYNERIDMGSLPTFVDNYSGLYGNRFNFL